MPIYEGPADTLIHNGRRYRRGDNVSMAKDVADQLRRAGHRFRDDPEPPATEPSLLFQPPADAAVGPPAPLLPMNPPPPPSEAASRATRATGR